MRFKTVSVIGLGYIGLPTAAMFASRELNVIGVDVNQDVVDTINEGEIHIVERDLAEMVQGVVEQGFLRASTQPVPADAFLIAVPTPFKPCGENGTPEPDLSYIQAAANAISPMLRKGNLVILESTSPVGATEQLAEWLSEARPDLVVPNSDRDESDIYVAHCPERVLPGQVIRELVENDRVIGGITKESSRLAVELYKVFVEGECVVTNARTAEMAKLTENSCRDVQIAFANELSVICDKLDINVWELIKLANRHPRVNILNPGPGVGGHCIAVDPWFIVNSCPKEAQLIKQARLTNDAKPNYVIKQVVKAAAEFKRPVIACLGLAFKANIDDLRESPALQIVDALASLEQKNGLGKIVVVEPNVAQLPEQLKNRGVALVGLEHALEQANIVVVLVDHQEFKMIDAEQLMAKVLVDTRGVVQL